MSPKKTNKKKNTSILEDEVDQVRKVMEKLVKYPKNEKLQEEKGEQPSQLLLFL